MIFNECCELHGPSSRDFMNYWGGGSAKILFAVPIFVHQREYKAPWRRGKQKAISFYLFLLCSVARCKVSILEDDGDESLALELNKSGEEELRLLSFFCPEEFSCEGYVGAVALASHLGGKWRTYWASSSEPCSTMSVSVLTSHQNIWLGVYLSLQQSFFFFLLYSIV